MESEGALRAIQEQEERRRQQSGGSVLQGYGNAAQEEEDEETHAVKKKEEEREKETRRRNSKAPKGIDENLLRKNQNTLLTLAPRRTASQGRKGTRERSKSPSTSTSEPTVPKCEGQWQLQSPSPLRDGKDTSET